MKEEPKQIFTIAKAFKAGALGVKYGAMRSIHREAIGAMLQNIMGASTSMGDSSKFRQLRNLLISLIVTSRMELNLVLNILTLHTSSLKM